MYHRLDRRGTLFYIIFSLWLYVRDVFCVHLTLSSKPFFSLSHYHVSAKQPNALSHPRQLIDHIRTLADVPVSHPCESSSTPQGSAKVSTATTALFCLNIRVAVHPFILLSIDWVTFTKAPHPIHQISTAESTRSYYCYDPFYPQFFPSFSGERAECGTTR